jgi:hypothetical protein
LKAGLKVAQMVEMKAALRVEYWAGRMAAS